MNIEERLDKIPHKIKENNFRSNIGLGNEVGYYIFDYNEKDELRVRNYIKDMVQSYSQSDSDYNLIEYDLYEIMINYLIERDLLQACFDMEQEDGFDYTAEAIANLFRIHNKFNYFIEYIDNNTPDNSVVFITGVGKVYPIFRSHSILNKLHQSISRVPVVLFFPGEWDGQRLKLFSKIDDGNYYRAFRLVD